MRSKKQYSDTRQPQKLCFLLDVNPRHRTGAREPYNIAASRDPCDLRDRDRQMNRGRAGHVAVVVDRRLFISGGACGTQCSEEFFQRFLNFLADRYYGKGKWYILDTDAPPLIEVAAPPVCADSVRRVVALETPKETLKSCINLLWP